MRGRTGNEKTCTTHVNRRIHSKERQRGKKLSAIIARTIREYTVHYRNYSTLRKKQRERRQCPEDGDRLSTMRKKPRVKR
jgi:hypothetical protein